MQEEIKEILDYLRKYIDNEETGEVIESKHTMNLLLDCITNLEQENERLKERINKAYKVLDEITFFTTPIGQVVHLDMIISDIKKVKSILKGSDNND